MGNFVAFFRQVSGRLQAEGHYGTAHIYRSTLNTVLLFQGNDHLSFKQITPGWLKGFETFVRKRGCSWNTVSTYLRVLRAVYNRAVDLRKAAYVPQQFRSVYTGTRTDKKRALDEEDIQKVFRQVSAKSAGIPQELRQVQQWFILMFLLRGLPFVDLAYLKKSDLRGNTITYRRRKTGRPLSVTLTPESMRLLEKYVNDDNDSPYLLPILTSAEGTEAAYREYQLALRSFNRRLMLLSQLLGLGNKLSSYVARHTWATTAYHCEVHPGIISEAMGHSSITVTETYLKPFRNKKIDEANNTVISFVSRISGYSIA